MSYRSVHTCDHCGRESSSPSYYGGPPKDWYTLYPPDGESDDDEDPDDRPVKGKHFCTGTCLKNAVLSLS